MKRAHVVLAFAPFALAACDHPSSGSPDAPIVVAAAADLSQAFKEVGAAFEKERGRKVTFTFGATGLLAKQIEEGARYDVFAAANVSYVDEAVKANACDGATKATYARGHLVVWTKDGVKPATSLEDLTDARFVKIAIANPEHAPYGKAAREALQKAGVWEKIKDKIVNGENVRQAMQFAQSGNAEAAIVGLSLTTNAKGGASLPVDEKLFTPLDQAMAVCKGPAGADAAKAFMVFVNGPSGRAIMKRYGFLLPGE